MIKRVLAFVAVTAVVVYVGYDAVFFATLGNCGMGPDAQQSCYDRQSPWVFATIGAFLGFEVAAAFLIFRQNKGR